MTDRLYYADSYARQFTARVLEQIMLDERPAVVLDRTLFYPESGGQPSDRGTLGGADVMDVISRESDRAVLHVLSRPLRATDVQGEVDWARRFDHMQQHTGQHILSQAFLRTAEAETVSFHLGADSVTIDIAAERVTPALAEKTEATANGVVIGDAPVRAWFPAADEIVKLSLRKTPEVDGALRVVAIGDFDFTACGGTHVARTGEVGLVKILKVEKQKKNTRVEFRCGWRALGDYGRKNTLVNQLAADFTCGIAEVDQAVAKLRAEANALRKELKSAREELIGHEAAEMIASAPTHGGWKVIRKGWTGRDVNEVRGLAARLTATPGTVALLGTGGAKAHVVLARAQDIDRDMNLLFKSVIALLDGARGGGDARLAQGGGVSADLVTVERVLNQAEQELFK